MKADILDIDKILDGNRKGYSIPPYQRPYKWDSEDAEKLIEDVYVSFRSKDQEYFIGSIICIKKEDGRYEVVDGQQRLITLTIIIKELANLIDEQAKKSYLESKFLWTDPIARKSVHAHVAVLKVRKSEDDFYLNRILQGKEEIKSKTDTQKVFLNNQEKIQEYLSKIKREELSEVIEHLLRKVFVVFVEVDDRASSFRLFNVLNNRGMSLSDSDLLKNTLLENVSTSSERTNSVERNWQNIESIVQEENLTKFFALHLNSEKRDRNRVRERIFSYYDARLKSHFDSDAVNMSNMLVTSAENYRTIISEDMGVGSVVQFLEDLSKPDEWVPAFMAFLNKISDREKFKQFVELFEKVYMQRWLRNLPKSQREGVRYSAVEVINNNKSFDEIMDCLREFSNTKEFDQQLDSEIFYDGSRPQIINLVKAVLKRVDAARHDGSVQVKYVGRISVEHILPRKVEENSSWSKLFTPDQHQEWLHKLGNLTLISSWKNSAARNFCFEKKKEAYEKYNQKCPFEITKEICRLSEWNMYELQKRHEKLKSEIKDLWVVK